MKYMIMKKWVNAQKQSSSFVVKQGYPILVGVTGVSKCRQITIEKKCKSILKFNFLKIYLEDQKYVKERLSIEGRLLQKIKQKLVSF